MASIRSGARSALIIVDAQVGVLRDGFNAAGVIANIRSAVAQARGAGVPVIWVRHADAQLPAGSADWQIVPELAPAPGEAIIEKHYNSAFEETALEAQLAALGVTGLVLAGSATIGCIRATVYAALDRGYDLTLIEDAHTMPSFEPVPGIRLQAEAIIADLNVTLHWLRYPGRSSTTVATAALAF